MNRLPSPLSKLLIEVREEVQLAADDTVDEEDDNSSVTISLGLLPHFVSDDRIGEGAELDALNVARESSWMIRFHFSFDALGNSGVDTDDEDSVQDFFFQDSDVASRAGRL